MIFIVGYVFLRFYNMRKNNDNVNGERIMTKPVMREQ